MSLSGSQGDYVKREGVIISPIISPGVKNKRSKDYSKHKFISSGVHYSYLSPIILDGVEVTPQCLNPRVYESGRERQINILDPQVRSFVGSEMTINRLESQKFKADILQQSRLETDPVIARSYISTFYNEDTVIESIGVRSDSSWRFCELGLEDDFDDGYESVEKMTKPPETISLILRETETIFLLNLPSSTALKGTAEGDLAEEANAHYEYLTEGKGRNRKVVNVEVQTIPILMKTRDTEAIRIKFKSNTTFASNWEMYDTYNEKQNAQDHSDDEIDLEFQKNHQLNEIASNESFNISIEEKELSVLIKNTRFLDAVTIIERLLANNCFNEQQKRFKGLSDPDPFRENIKFDYRLDLLWTFQNDDTMAKCVSKIALNPCNDEVIAVTYGKFHFQDRNIPGLALVWNIKNPEQPERRYIFPQSAISLDFSTTNPNLLAVGFYGGFIRILDISRRDNNVLYEDRSSFEPVWDLVWFMQGNEECLMASFGDGCVFRYQILPSVGLKHVQIMKTPRTDGKLKGIRGMKKCTFKETAICRYAMAKCLTLHPADPSMYFVGTNEGSIHKCSINYFNQHIDLFQAHWGTVTGMRFSPFAQKLFVTTGDDLQTRAWIEGIAEPIMEARMNLFNVNDIALSTSHSTVLISIRGAHILVWDLQRRTYQPIRLVQVPSNCTTTICKFITSGRCILVGDIVGNVYVYSLEDMPFPSFFPENALVQSIKNGLMAHKELLKKIEKIGSFNYKKQQFNKYFN